MIDLTAIWPRRPARQPRVTRPSGTQHVAVRSRAPAAIAATPHRLPRRPRTLTILSAGLLLALLLAAVNAAVLLSATAPQAAAAPSQTRHSFASETAGHPAPGVPALAGRAHNAAILIALREKAASANRHRPVMFALLVIQALVMGATTYYLWNRAGQIFAPATSDRRQPRRAVNRSEDGYARG